jgi:hypothetical protein
MSDVRRVAWRHMDRAENELANRVRRRVVGGERAGRDRGHSRRRSHHDPIRGIGDHHVPTRAAVNPVAVVLVPDDDPVAARAGEHPVVTSSVEQRVAAAIANRDVVPGTALQQVVAQASPQPIVPVEGRQLVAAAPAVDPVGAATCKTRNIR